jgi:hypothetical protein
MVWLYGNVNGCDAEESRSAFTEKLSLGLRARGGAV